MCLGSNFIFRGCRNEHIIPEASVSPHMWGLICWDFHGTDGKGHDMAWCFGYNPHGPVERRRGFVVVLRVLCWVKKRATRKFVRKNQ